MLGKKVGGNDGARTEDMSVVRPLGWRIPRAGLPFGSDCMPEFAKELLGGGDWRNSSAGRSSEASFSVGSRGDPESACASLVTVVPALNDRHFCVETPVLSSPLVVRGPGQRPGALRATGEGSEVERPKRA